MVRGLVIATTALALLVIATRDSAAKEAAENNLPLEAGGATEGGGHRTTRLAAATGDTNTRLRNPGGNVRTSVYGKIVELVFTDMISHG